MDNTEVSLTFCRQFVLAPTDKHKIDGWSVHALRRYGFVQLHPDIACSQKSNDKLELTLIGFALDPLNVNATDAQILDELIGGANSAADVLKLTDKLGGRWILIAIDKDNGLLFTDPMGMREVYYLHQGETWCASQCVHIARPLELEIDPDTRDNFLNTAYVQSGHEYFWPTDLTPYREIRHLTPNHVLDLNSMEAHRFWPRQQLQQKTLDQCVDEVLPLFKGIIDAAHTRYPLALPLTAGFDSRTILAATRSFASDIFYYTMRPHDYADDHNDLNIPTKLSRVLRLQHHMIDCPEKTSDRFWMLLSESVSPAHESTGRRIEGLLRQYPPGYIALSGTGGEIFRDAYDYLGSKVKTTIDAHLLTELFEMKGIPFAEKAFDAWLRQVKLTADESGIHVLDLFYWENRVGRWGANAHAQWDFVQERFSPFNCRVLLECMLSVDVKYRQYPTYYLNKRIIGALWPNILSVPFNPPATRGRRFELTTASRNLLENVLSRLGMLSFARKLWHRIKRNV